MPFNFPPELVHAFDDAVPLTERGALDPRRLIALEGQGERYWDTPWGWACPTTSVPSNTVELGSHARQRRLAAGRHHLRRARRLRRERKIHEFVAHYLDIPQFSCSRSP